MTNYIYRIDPVNLFEKITDGVFRAKRYMRGGYPHRFLLAQLDSIPPNHAVYRICFYSNISITERSLNFDFASLKPCLVHKICDQHLVDAGFNQAWDDGFNEGEAPMFWIVEELNGTNEKYSKANLHLCLFELVNID